MRKSADNAIATFLAIDEDKNPLILISFIELTNVIYSFKLK